MIKVKATFTIATTYIKSAYSQEQDFEFDDDTEQTDMEDVIIEAYREWLSEHNYGGWSIDSQETIKEEE